VNEGGRRTWAAGHLQLGPTFWISSPGMDIFFALPALPWLLLHTLYCWLPSPSCLRFAVPMSCGFFDVSAGSFAFAATTAVAACRPRAPCLIPALLHLPCLYATFCLFCMHLPSPPFAGWQHAGADWLLAPALLRWRGDSATRRVMQRLWTCVMATACALAHLNNNR